MINAVFGKTMENLKKHRDIKLAITDRTRKYLVSEPNYHATMPFAENLLAIEMKEIEIFMNKPLCLGLSMLELSKILMHEFWHDQVKSKSTEKGKFCYMDTDSFFVYIKPDDIYKEVAVVIETRFDTSNYELDRPLSQVGKKVIGLIKDELGGKIITTFVGLISNT